MLQYLSTTFLAGLLALLPLLITIAVAWFLYVKLLIWLGPQSRFGKLPKLIAEKTELHPSLAYMAVFAIVALVILGIGVVAKRSTEASVARFVDRIPILRYVYGGTEQMVHALRDSQRGMPRGFNQVVVARLHNAKVLGIRASDEPVMLDGEPHYTVYFPNAPIPAAGQIYLVPVRDTSDVDISVEELMQVYVSMGSLSARTLEGKIADPAAADADAAAEKR
jgi:uncharacterized membrane protein